jgi:ABC-type multidrug transport system fused ATPase/permease subunit
VSQIAERVRRCDVAWHLEAGRLVAAGKPSELLAEGEATARLLRAARTS